MVDRTTFGLMRRVISEYPDLTTYGFGVYGRRLSAEERRAMFDSMRAELLSDGELAGFERAITWLSQFEVLNRHNRRGTSYGLKHVAEPYIGYCTNGTFIAAAAASGFDPQPAEPGSPNALLKIAGAAWNRALTMADHERLAAAIGRAHEALNEIAGVLSDREQYRRAAAVNASLFRLQTDLSRPSGMRDAVREKINLLYYDAITRAREPAAEASGS